MNSWMYFELNRHPAHIASTKIEFWGGLISDLEHCGVGDVSPRPISFRRPFDCISTSAVDKTI